MNCFNYFKVFASIAAVAFGLAGLSASAAPIAPAAPLATDDIRDIRPPIHIAAPFPWLAFSTGALGLAGMAAVAWKLARRRQGKLAYEIALERLEKTRLLMRENNAESFCLAVSEIVRLFIEEVLPVRAVHRTTNEFLHDLARVFCQPQTSYRYPLANFLCHCDLAKFARWSLSVQEMEAMLESAKAFVVELGQPRSPETQLAAEANLATANPITANSSPLIP